MKKPFLMILLVVFAGVNSFPKERTVQFTIYGGLNYHFSLGSEDEHVIGENDFPVTPDHKPIMLGIAYSRFFRHIGVEIDWRYTVSSSVILEDPLDGDTVEIRSTPHLTLVLNLLYKPFSGRISPYLLAGGGADILFAEEAAYTTTYGYKIVIQAPSKKERVDWEAHAGFGIQAYLAGALGIRMEVRYVWIFDKPHTVKSLQAVGGLLLGF